MLYTTMGVFSGIFSKYMMTVIMRSILMKSFSSAFIRLLGVISIPVTIANIAMRPSLTKVIPTTLQLIVLHHMKRKIERMKT